MGKKNHKNAPYMCGQCKAGFEHERAVVRHIKDAHRQGHHIGVYRCIQRVNGPEFDDEPSFADRAIEARIALNSGLQTEDDWLLGE